jgi:hypothetical protein
MVAITLASHLRVYGVSVPHPPPPQPSNWTRGRTTHSPSARAGPPWRSRCPCAPTTGRRRCCRCPRTNTDQQPTTATLGRPVMYYYQDYDGSGKNGGKAAQSRVLSLRRCPEMLMFSFLWIVVAEARCVLTGDDRWRQYDPERGDGRRCS